MAPLISYTIISHRARFYQQNSEATGKGNSFVESSNKCNGKSQTGTHVWPLRGWLNSPERFPIVSSMVLLNHLMRTGKCAPVLKDMVVVQKPLKRGYDLFFEATFTKLNCN